MLAALVAGFLFTPTGRARCWRSAAAALLLTSRRMASRDMLGLVDWHLLVLFIGLFVVNHALAAAGLAAAAREALARVGRRPRRPRAGCSP